MSSEIDAILGKRRERVSRRVFELLEDYIYAYTNPGRLNLLTIEEAKKGLTSPEEKVFDVICRSSRKGFLVSRGEIESKTEYERGFVARIVKTLSQKRIVGDYNIIEYACIFLQGIKYLKFSPPMDISCKMYEGYFKGYRGKRLMYKMSKNPEKRKYLPKLAYARVLIDDIPIYRRVFPKPGEIILFQTFDSLFQ